MSYLVLPYGIPDFSQAVISFWFRVPAATLAATALAWKTDNSALRGITPLLMFGDNAAQGYELNSTEKTFRTFTHERWKRLPIIGDHLHLTDSFPQSRKQFVTVPGEPIPKPSCYIGIDCNRELVASDPAALPNILRIRLQLPTIGSGSGATYNVGAYTGPDLLVEYAGSDFSGTGPPDRFGTVIYSSATRQYLIKEHNPFQETMHFTDVTDMWMRAQTEWADIALSGLSVTPDHWHHVLVSFNLRGTIAASGMQNHQPAKGTITTDCRIWVAYDDVNYKGAALHKGSYDAENIEPPDDNALFTKNAAFVARLNAQPSSTTSPVYGFNGWEEVLTISGFTRPTYSYTPPGVAALNHPIGIPASGAYVDKIRKCEMAEFQMWTGRTLDTGIVTNRRAFVDADGVPVAPTMAEASLGKKQAVLLHGSEKWKEGRNTGSFEGQFERRGVINTYVPDPSLHGAQSPSRAAPVRLTRAAANARL